MLLFDFHVDGCQNNVCYSSTCDVSTSVGLTHLLAFCTMKSQQHSDQNDAFKGFSCLYKLEYALKKLHCCLNGTV